MKILNQQIMKNHNLKKIFSLILRHGSISRIELAALTKLSKTTISSLADSLIQGNFIMDTGEIITGRQGRKPSLLRVNAEKNVVAVINWRLEELELSLVDMNGQVIYYQQKEIGGQTDFAELIPQAYYEVLEPQIGQRNFLGLCLIVPSMLDVSSYRMISTVLPVREEDDVLRQIHEKLKGKLTAVFNDTACYAYAENVFSQREFDTFLFININKGVGAVIVQDGTMIKGEAGMRSQLGHFSIDRYGSPCVCGNRGCLENLIGESALLSRAERLGVAKELLPKNKKISFEYLGKLADSGNQTAMDFVSGLAADLAFALSNVLVIYNTDHIIIGGKGQRLGRYYLQQLEMYLKKQGFFIFVSRAGVWYTDLSDDAIMRGAARYYIDKFYQFFEDMSGFFVIE